MTCVKSFSKELDKFYDELIKEFESDIECSNFKSYKNPEMVINKMQMAGNIYWWLSTHFCKAKDAIDKYEKENKNDLTSIIKQKNITVVDLGAVVAGK